MARIEITEDALIAALSAAAEGRSGNGQNALTKRELVGLTGWSDDRVYKRLHALHEAGRLGVTRVVREGMDGVRRPVTGYYVRGEET